jgi:CRP/FNR family transcriptional regulator, cyclic AMP receptor protein
MKRSEALAQVPLFSSLSPKHLRQLAKQTLDYRYEPGHVLITQGEEGETLFVVLEGEAKIVRNNRTVARVGPGGFVGEIAVLRGRARSANVVAVDEVRCLVLHRETLRKLLADEPKAAWAMLGELAGRIRGD